MSIKSKLVAESMDRIFREASKGGMPFDTIQELLSSAYDAGMVETPDQDAARWRMFSTHFADQRAKFVRSITFVPRMTQFVPFSGTDVSTATLGAQWRLDVAWTERTGNADTIPKFIDLLMTEHAAEQEKGND